MTTPNFVARPIYVKHNSFVAIRSKDNNAEQLALERIRRLSENRDLTLRLSASQIPILQAALSDLYSADLAPGGARFSLSASVIDEVLSFPDDAALSLYLVHRYRYEINPERHIIDDYPPYVQIEPSSMCNYRCVFCFETDNNFTKKSNGHMGFMPLDLFKSVVDQLEGNVEFISLASRGEPLLNPDIVPMLNYTRGKFLNLKINTNASLLDESKCHAILQSGVKTLVFSVDAAVEPLYSKLRVNGKLENVLANIEQFQQIRATQYREARIITRVSGVKVSNAQNLDEMNAFWGGLVDQVAFVNYNPWENTYKQPENGLRQPCSDLWRRMFVWWDGKMNPCDVDYMSRLSVGRFQEYGIREAWHSEPYAKLRKNHLEGRRYAHDPCSRCTVT